MPIGLTAARAWPTSCMDSGSSKTPATFRSPQTKLPPMAPPFLRNLLGIVPEESEPGARHQSVSVMQVGDIDVAATLTDRLRALKLQVDDAAALTIVLADDYLRPELADFNRRALASAHPWLLVKPVGATIWCGPFFSPGETACWACLARRLRERNLWSALNRGVERPRLSRASLESTVRMGVEMAATEVWKWVMGAPGSGLAGRLVTFDTRSLTAETHIVVRQPTCAECGSRTSASWSAPQLQSRMKRTVSDGGYRCESPDATYDRFKHHISPITGIADRVEPKSAGQLDLVQIFSAPYTFARPLELTHVPPTRDTRLRSAGKGMSASQARTGAFCEAAERYAGIYRGDEVRRTARAVDLDAAYIAPNACMQFSDRQYDERDEWNRRGLRFHWVPVPFESRACHRMDACVVAHRAAVEIHPDGVLLLRVSHAPRAGVLPGRLQWKRCGHESRGGHPARVHGAGRAGCGRLVVVSTEFTGRR